MKKDTPKPASQLADRLAPPPKNPHEEADSGRLQELFVADGPVGDINRPPSHYASSNGLQPFDIIDAFGLDFYEGCVIKYLLRWRKKDGVDDLKKARHYLDEVIRRAESQ